MALERILAAKRAAVERRKHQRPLERWLGTLVPARRSLSEALLRRGCGFILECKKRSPSQGLLRQDFDPADLALRYAPVADAVSVLTDEPYFGGDLENLARVRDAVDLPLLCKDFVVDPYQVYEARRHGADAVLLMLSVLDDAALARCFEVVEALGMEALFEVHDEPELDRALALSPKLVGINNRDLKTLAVSLEVTERLAPLVPAGIVRISESGIEERRDVLRLRPLVDGFLVGSSLMRREDLEDAARELVYGRVKVCGLTNSVDARAARRAGATWGGLVLAPESPRRVSFERAEQLCKSVDLRWVGVFVNADPEQVARVAQKLRLAAVQLHGDERRDEVEALRRRLPASCEVWKAWRVRDRVPRLEETGADRLLLDGYEPGRRGGTGKSFDWRLLERAGQLDRVIVGGGLGSENAAAAGALGAWALDVSSGVESAPGRKSAERLVLFFRNLRAGGR
jgi:indole-3-glycerol phosphate synthase / phosphoribosylanthranilate isomerase